LSKRIFHQTRWSEGASNEAATIYRFDSVDPFEFRQVNRFVINFPAVETVQKSLTFGGEFIQHIPHPPCRNRLTTTAYRTNRVNTLDCVYFSYNLVDEIATKGEWRMKKPATECDGLAV
jgi:hypothetical protein